MDNLKCCKCGNPLRIVRGGHKSDIGSTEIIMVHVFGCFNDACELALQEQCRTENKVESFSE